MLWFFGQSDTSVLEASKKEQHAAITRIVSQGTWHSGYYVLLFLAVLIVTPGLLINNVAVIIGGMILAPLIIPTAALSMSLVAGNLHGTIRALWNIFLSIVIAVGTSMLLTFVIARTYHVVTWIPEEISPGIYIFIAFCSGVAGALALVKENLAPTIAGVAIAVSLLPPLAASGIGLALEQYVLVQNSLVLFSANFLGIALGALPVFWILGFPGAGKVQERVMEEND